jgi:hypothetical protein
LKLVARDFARDAKVRNVIAENFYIDNLLKSCETEQEAILLIKNLKSTIVQAGFNLTKWVSDFQVCNLLHGNKERLLKLDLSAEDCPMA